MTLMTAHSSNSESQSTSAAATHAESSYHLEHVADGDLLASTRRLVGSSNQILAALLAHLAEVEARGIHRLRACASLYTYCVYELRLSEDAAFRRARAARVARRFPVIFQQIAEGELHLTALTLLAPHLTQENHRELLALAKHRTKREVLRIVRALAPAPTVRDHVEPLGAEPIGIPIPRAASWQRLVESLACPVRELPPGDRPKDWLDPPDGGSTSPNTTSPNTTSPNTTSPNTTRPVTISPDITSPDITSPNGTGVGPAPECSARPTSEPFTGPANETATGSERYRVQFTASQEYVDLLERAQDLLSHAEPDRSLERVHLRALRLLVEQLEKRKYGAPPRSSPEAPGATHGVTASQPVQRKKHAQPPRQRGTSITRGGKAAVRREVRDRDGPRCAFVDERGQRCRETRFLELHHQLAHAFGGEPVAHNLKLYCAAHNALAAEQDFGREFIEARRRCHPSMGRYAARPPP